MSLGQQHAYHAPTHSHCWHQGVVVSDPVLLSDILNGLAGGTAPRDRDVSRLLRDYQLAWAHLNADHPNTSAWLRRKVGYLIEFAVNALFASEN